MLMSTIKAAVSRLCPTPSLFLTPTWRTTKIRKYVLAILRNCSKRFRGKKVTRLYLVDLMTLFYKVQNRITLSQITEQGITIQEIDTYFLKHSLTVCIWVSI